MKLIFGNSIRPGFMVLAVAMLVAPVSAQNAKQIEVSGRFITAFLNHDWQTFDGLSNPMLKSQSDTSLFEGIVTHLDTTLGAATSRWLASAQTNGDNIMLTWHTHFERDSLAVQVVVDGQYLASGIWLRPIEPPYEYLPPAYADESAFTEERTIFGGETKLPGTLTLPNGTGPFPAVVLVAGSGPNDRDETIKGNKPFRDIAWGLASQGIASFRYDKRTHVYPDKFDSKTMSVEEEVIVDALEALKFLAKQKNIDTQHIYLLGHSLGGMMGPEIASRSDVPHGLIMLATPARDLVTVTIGQLEFFRKNTDPKQKTEIQQYEEQILAGKQILKGAATMRDEFLGVSANYYYKLNTYNQLNKAASLTMPIFIAQAGKDYQVPMVDYEIWKQALKGKKNVTLKEYPECFHLFINAKDEPGRSNYNVEGHVVKQLIDDLASWMKTR